MTKSRMYEVEGERVRTWNPFVGCLHDCIYCYAREQAKRRKRKCEKCYNFEPHFHPERLNKKFKAGETWFVCSMGDISFASLEQFEVILHIINNHSWYPSTNLSTTFYLQSKNPYFFHNFETYPNNLYLGTTIESNIENQIPQKAPTCKSRYLAMKTLTHNKKYITIEPILKFDLDWLVEWVEEIAPEFVYVGYLNPLWKAKKLQIPEPPLGETEELINELKKFTVVRLKTIRKGWDEK